jgi:hypothetical protein
LWFCIYGCATDCGVWSNETYESELSIDEIDRRYGCECRPTVENDMKISPPLLRCTPRNWLAKYDMQLHNYGSVAAKYCASAYFTIIGLSTVGFGDVTPSNDLERFFSIICVLIGALIFAIVIGSVSEIAQQTNQFESSVQGSVQSLADFLEHRNVTDLNCKIIQRQITYSSQKAPHLWTDAHKMLEALPRHLRKSLMKHLMTEQLGFAIQGFPIFFKMDAELRATFLLLLRPVLLGDQDFLFEALDVGREGHKEYET